jgi:hypothetical protein
MNFSNINIAITDLPSIESVDFNPLEKAYLKVSRLTYLISTIIVIAIIIAIFYFIKKIQTPIVMSSTTGVLSVFTIFGWIANTLSFNYSGYALRERDVLFRRGWLVRKVRIVPLKRIQHVSLQSGPIERKFGLASISIFTAGSEEADFTINGITKETAQQIKDWIGIQLNGELN